MPLEDFKAHLRTLAGEDPKAEIISPARPNPMLVPIAESRNQRQSEGGAESSESAARRDDKTRHFLVVIRRFAAHVAL